MKVVIVLSLFMAFSVFAESCGLQGSVEERIKDCKQTKGNFALVTITQKGFEIYKDIKSGLIWGDRLAADFNHYGSERACSEDVVDYMVLESLKWRLPTIKELKIAAADGMKFALPNVDHWFWSSTLVKTKKRYRRRGVPASVYLWDAQEEKVDTGDLRDGASVRCVARE